MEMEEMMAIETMVLRRLHPENLPKINRLGLKQAQDHLEVQETQMILVATMETRETTKKKTTTMKTTMKTLRIPSYYHSWLE